MENATTAAQPENVTAPGAEKAIAADRDVENPRGRVTAARVRTVEKAADKDISTRMAVPCRELSQPPNQENKY